MPKKKNGPQLPEGHPLAPKTTKMSKGKQTLIVVAGLAAIAALLTPLYLTRDNGDELAPTEVRLNEVLAVISAGGDGNGRMLTATKIDEASQSIVVRLSDGTQYAANYPSEFGDDLVSRLEETGVPFESNPPKNPSRWGSILLTLVPTILILGFLIFLMRRAGMAGGAARAFAATKADVGDVPSARFDEVVGCEEAVEELSEIVEFLRDPSRFAAAGARMPRGFLLVGPPGTGKTLLARAVAGEAGVPFYSAAGSDFTEMFVGVGAARVRDLFTKAKKTGGIIFLDEIDSVGRARVGGASSGGTEEREGTLNALLVEMDGFSKDENVIVIAATNRPDVLDPALLRAGRFDRQVVVAAPDRAGRTKLLELYAKDRRIAPDVDFVALARRMPGLTGADIANLVNQAALEAARKKREEITADDFAEALATVMMGRARRSAVMTDRDREVTAWHEAGHTVAALILPDANDPVQVTIIPRGVAGGVTWMGGDDDAFLTSSQARAQLAVAMAGRAAEEILLDGDFTQGASSDIANATSLATRMVTQWGMSPLGVTAMNPERATGSLADRIHAEVDRLLTEALQTARTLLSTNRPLLDAIIAELLAEETIDLARIEALQTRVGGTPAGAEPGRVPARPGSADELLKKTA